MGVTALASDMAAGMRCEALVGRDDELALINRFLEHLVEGDSVDPASRVASAANVGANVTGDLPNADALRTRAHGTDTEVSGSLEAASAAALMLLVTDGDIDAAGRLLRHAIEPAMEDHDEPICGDAVRTLTGICVSGARADLWEALGRLIDRCPDRIPPAGVMHATIALDPVRCPASVLAGVGRRHPGAGTRGGFGRGRCASPERRCSSIACRRAVRLCNASRATSLPPVR